jgi:hypothetical protein
MNYPPWQDLLFQLKRRQVPQVMSLLLAPQVPQTQALVAPVLPVAHLMVV